MTIDVTNSMINLKNAFRKMINYFNHLVYILRIIKKFNNEDFIGW